MLRLQKEYQSIGRNGDADRLLQIFQALEVLSEKVVPEDSLEQIIRENQYYNLLIRLGDYQCSKGPGLATNLAQESFQMMTEVLEEFMAGELRENSKMEYLYREKIGEYLKSFYPHLKVREKSFPLNILIFTLENGNKKYCLQKFCENVRREEQAMSLEKWSELLNICSIDAGYLESVPTKYEEILKTPLWVPYFLVYELEQPIKQIFLGYQGSLKSYIAQSQREIAQLLRRKHENMNLEIQIGEICLLVLQLNTSILGLCYFTIQFVLQLLLGNDIQK
jgi:hypothetical protein